MRRYTKLGATLALAVAAAFAPLGNAGTNEAKQWVDKEFQPSTLSKAQQMKEMEWFINAAKPFKGLEINVLSETIPTHEYESKVLTKAFFEITGIKVNHQLLGEGEGQHRQRREEQHRSDAGDHGASHRYHAMSTTR